ncbi:LysR family transcriptional regulator [Marivita hallyeonensis]|uniref:DNA-binding transcriptional regulator, LysR family n=1 Tax=Marivita hallyeonensis TaxID=996342 RepID=A0A1M5S787_9RHOB|nr:LysR family transcriptional regulator [Marivita hallyeonensis]SHH33793.1 DNA-binding transcriptional regulator, LysR family [Marivita hallyeonensis]
MAKAIMVNLEDLRIVFFLYEAGSLSAAARRFEVPKATLSRSLARLEDQAGIPLFDRQSTGLKLTQAGEMLLPAAKAATEAGATADDVLRRASGEPEGELRIAASALSAQQILGPIIGEFSRLYPKVTVRVKVTGHGPDPLEEDLDLVLRLGRPDEPYLITRRVIASTFGLYGPPDCQDKPFTKAEIKELGRIVIDVPGAPLDWEMQDTNGRRLRLDAAPMCFVGDPSVALGILASGKGVAFLPAIFGDRKVLSGELARLFPEFSGPDIEIYAAFPPKRAEIPAVRAFLDLMVDMSEETHTR